MVVMFDPEQLIGDEVRESNRPMGEAMKGSCGFNLRGTQNQQSPKHPDHVIYNDV